MRGRWGRKSLPFFESVLSSHGCLYTFNALYIIANIMLFLNAAYDESKLHSNYRKYTTSIARGCGATINFNIAVVILLASRSAIGLLRETPLSMVLPLDMAMPHMHRLVGMFVVVASLVHAVAHIPMYVISNPWSPGLTGLTSLFVTGCLLVILMIVIRIVAREVVYHHRYELFLRTHIFGGALAYLLLIIHGMHHGSPNTWKWVIGPLCIYAFDVLLRSYREKRSYLLVSKHSTATQGEDIIKIRLPRVFHFQAGQYAELKVPQISRWQWHPFTIASAPHEAELVFYIKAVGDWTRTLYSIFNNQPSLECGTDIEIHIRGPFGSPTQHVGQFDRVILVGGGVGATPFCSVVKDAHYCITNWTSQNHQDKFAKRHIIPHEQGVIRPPQRQRGHQSARTPSVAGISDAIRSVETSTHATESSAFRTNVVSEKLDSFSLPAVEKGIRRPPPVARARAEGRRSIVSDDRTTDGGTMVTACDFFVSSQDGIGDSSSGSDPTSLYIRKAETATEHKPGSNSLASLQSREERRGTTFKRDHPGADAGNDDVDGMGSYYEHSIGETHQRSMDYITALQSAYLMDDAGDVFQRGLDMMVAFSFGSVEFVRNMQLKRVQRNLRQGISAPVPVQIGRDSLGILENPRIMFLLVMRSVTVNLGVFWLLMLRFTMAGGAFIFNRFRVFEDGVALYTDLGLNIVDLVLVMLLTVMVGVPPIVEMIELGSTPIQGFDLFVVAPIAACGIAVDILAIANVGQDVDSLFNVFHVFVVWPALTVLIGYRLLRVIGERITQAENMTASHSSTRSVDFYWTAPTGHDDRWLVREVRRYADIDEVKMHRYLTRTNEGDSGVQIESSAARSGARSGNGGVEKRKEREGSLHTNFGRPDWMEIFNEVADCSPNNTTVGVFFCGPHTMGQSVQEACMEAMRNSIVRGLQSGARAMRGLEEIFGEAVSANEYNDEVRGQRGAGCNVTFVFKRETFL